MLRNTIQMSQNMPAATTDRANHHGRNQDATSTPGGAHSQSSERTVLASALRAEKAHLLPALMGVLAGSDFFLNGHGAMWDCIRAIADSGDEVDGPKLIDYAAARQIFIGPPEYVMGLLDDPLTLHASDKTVTDAASRVKEFSVTRLLDATLKRARDMCATAAEPSQSIIARVEDDLINLKTIGQSARRGPKKLVTIFDGLLEHIENVQDGKAPMALSTTYAAVDALINGFYDEDLIIIAARPSMGKTSALLGLAKRRAVTHGRKSLIFSLESKDQSLAARILAGESGVSSADIRNARLDGEAMGRISDGLSRIGDLPIWIDDTPGLSIHEIRARARAFVAEHGACDIYVDYLQKVGASPDAKGRSSERHEHVSEVSSGLKFLARELGVPVIALSQLSRNLESRANKRPLMSDLRECVTGDTPVLLADGRRIEIRDLVGQTPEVLCLDVPSLKRSSAVASGVWRVGTREVIELVTRSGRSLRCTPDHLVYTERGWVRAGEVAVGERFAAARHTGGEGQTRTMTDQEALLLGHLIGDGSYVDGLMLRYTSGTPAHIDDVVACAASMGIGSRIRPGPTGSWDQVELLDRGTRHETGRLRGWLRELGIANQRSGTKRIPRAVFGNPPSVAKALLQGLWASDGCYHVHTKRGKVEPIAYYATNSRGLAVDVAALLLQLGVHSRVAKAGASFHVKITGRLDLLGFLDAVPASAGKSDQAMALRQAVEQMQGNTNLDTVPNSLFRPAVLASMKSRQVSQRAMAKLRGTSYGGSAHFNFSPSRDVIRQYANLLDDDALRRLGDSDVYWDEVVRVVPCGEEEVFDLSVPGHENWLADGLVCHNSGQIEQDADVIMFLYRDEYYNPDTKEPGIAEWIVAKQREGEVGTAKMGWASARTEFYDVMA